MKFTDTLILFCLLAAGIGFIALFFPVSSGQIVDRVFWLGVGLFSCWWQIKPRSSFLGRLCRFLKSIPRCWAESKETFK